METIIFLYESDLILSKAKNLNKYQKVLVTSNKAILNNYYNDFFKIIYVNNIFDAREIYEKLKVSLKDSIIKYIVPNFEGVLEVAAELRQRFNVPGLTVDETKKYRDKYVMKSIMKENNINCAYFCLLNNREEINEFVVKYKFPVVIKPRDGFGSKDTYIIKNEDELDNTLRIIQKDIKNFMMEKFVVGDEYHYDAIVEDGKVLFYSLGKYHNNLINTVNDTKLDGTIVYPQNNKNEEKSKINNFARKAIKAMKVKKAIIHMEVFYGEDIYFGEMGLRPAGGYIWKDIYNTSNVDIYDVYLKYMVDEPVKLDVKPRDVFTGNGVFPYKEGKVTSITKEEELSNIEGVKEVNIFYNIGDEIKDKESCLDRVGYFIVEGKSYEEVKEKVVQLYSTFKIETE